MKYALILILSTAACSTWLVPDEGGRVVGEVLRAPEKGEPVLVAGDRAYLLRNGALRGEVDGFSDALATVAERDEPVDVHARAESDGDVIAFAYPGRRLEFGTNTSSVIIQRAQGEAGSRYWATLNRGSRKHLFVSVRGTRELHAAWDRLERAAASQAGDARGPSPYVALWPMGAETGTSYVRGYLIDRPTHDIGVELADAE